MTQSRGRSRKTLGVLFILLSAFCFAFMTAFVRLAGDLPIIQKAFFRNVVAMVFSFCVLLRKKEGFLQKKENLPFLLLRALFGSLGILFNFYAIDHMVLSDANMLNKLSPFFVILFSFFFLKEKITPVQGIAVVLAFAGSLFIIKPTFLWGGSLDSIPALVGTLGGLCAGLAYTMVRICGQRGEKGPFIVFFFSLFSCLCFLPFLLFSYTPMTGMQLFYLLLAGLAASGGQFAITTAYLYAPAREISVYDYSQVAFSSLLGFLFFGQVPDSLSLIGYGIICLTAIGMFLYQNRS